MAEPLFTSAGLTLAASTAAVPIVYVFGVPLGLRPDLLMAGFFGALAAMALLNTVPSTGDTWREMVRTAARRMGVALASSLTAGYLTPLSLLLANVPESLLLAGAFAVGGGAQGALARAILRVRGTPPPADQKTGGEA